MNSLQHVYSHVFDVHNYGLLESDILSRALSDAESLLNDGSRLLSVDRRITIDRGLITTNRGLNVVKWYKLTASEFKLKLSCAIWQNPSLTVLLAWLVTSDVVSSEPYSAYLRFTAFMTYAKFQISVNKPCTVVWRY